MFFISEMSEEVCGKIAISAKGKKEKKRGEEGNEREKDERMTERKCCMRSAWKKKGDRKKE